MGDLCDAGKDKMMQLCRRAADLTLLQSNLPPDADADHCSFFNQ